MSAKILILDIETTRAVVETFNLWPKFISIDNVIEPSRILCFAAQWRGDSKQIIFNAAWNGDNLPYRLMIEAAFELLSEADFVVTWNGDRFDLQWLEAEFGRLKMGRPAPYRSIDLFKIARKQFGKGLLSLKLDWSARQWLGDQKASHEGLDLWHEIRYGNDAQKLKAQQIMRKYNIHDTELTGELFERYLPWIGENFALYEDNADDGTIRCTQCNSEDLTKEGFHPAKTYMYQRYKCKDCGKWNKGRKMVFTNELRPV